MGILFSRSSLSFRQGLTRGANPRQLRAMLRLETARIFSTKNGATTYHLSVFYNSLNIKYNDTSGEKRIAQ